MAAGAILGVTSLTYPGHVIYVQIDLDHAHGTDLHPTHDLPLVIMVIVLLHVNDVHVLAIDRLGWAGGTTVLHFASPLHAVMIIHQNRVPCIIVN